MVKRIRVPSSLNAKGLATFDSLLSDAAGFDAYELDFRPLTWAPPLGLLKASAAIRNYRKQHANASFVAAGHSTCPYAAHMGFFQAFGLDHGNVPGQAAGSDNYVPITQIDFSRMSGSGAWGGPDVHSLIERKSRELARVLAQSDDRPLFSVLDYCIREVICNSYDHGMIDSIWCCAQYWPSRGEVEVALLDEGVGVRCSLSRNPNLTPTSDRDALRLALLPGVSGSFHSEADLKVCRNAGFGLYMISRICGENGGLLVSSGDGAFAVRAESRVCDVKMTHQGMFVAMKIKVAALDPVEKSLEKYSAEGDDLAASIASAVGMTPAMLQSLSRRAFPSARPSDASTW